MRRKRLRAQQLVHQRDGQTGLAGAGRHREQDVLLARGDGRLNGDDRFAAGRGAAQ